MNKGFTILEVVLGVSIIAISMFSLMTVLNMSFQLMEESTRGIQASFLLEEGLESIRTLRDTSWDDNITTLSSDNAYYLVFSGGIWSSTSSNVFIDDIFDRSFVVNDVYRDSNDDIVNSGGSLDESTKKFTVSVSWSTKNGTTTKSISAFLSDLF
ncbi:hypothetical protein ACFLZC_02545 [Patescibacteria group bacterium]